jgi:hypothetical protein
VTVIPIINSGAISNNAARAMRIELRSDGRATASVDGNAGGLVSLRTDVDTHSVSATIAGMAMALAAAGKDWLTGNARSAPSRAGTAGYAPFGDDLRGGKTDSEFLGVSAVRIDETLPSEACRRAFPRLPVVLAASALAIARSRSVVVTDLSLEGAQLGGRDLPPAGDDLLMLVGSLDAMATVVWREGDKCGVQFDEAIADETIVQMKREADWSSVACWSH